MSLLDRLPENSVKRLSKVLVRSLHLVGVAGVFGDAMMQTFHTFYLDLAIASGIVLVLMEAWSGRIWFVQLRGVAVYAKLLLLVLMHIYPQAAIPWLIAMILISGFFSHAPGWIRYYSVQHRQVVYSKDDLRG